MECGLFDFRCKLTEGTASLATSALDRLAIAVTETLGELMGTLATAWVRINTPLLIGGGGGSLMRAAGDHAPGADGVETVLGWVMSIAFGIMVLSLIAAGVRLAAVRRNAAEHVGSIGIVLVATIVVSASVGIVSAVAPTGSVQGSAPVAYLQASLYWYMLVVAAIGVIAGGVKMAWQLRSEPGMDVVRSILTLAVVSGAGVTTVSLLTAAADAFAEWILDGSMGCSLDADGACFSQAMGELLFQAAEGAPAPTLPGLLTVILGLLAILAVITQIVLMVVRSAMLVVLSGMLPMSAAATNTAVGGQMFKKTIGWLVGMILYKPAAAIIYAAAFTLVGDNTETRADAVMTTISGLTLIVMALIALPALMALIVPATAAVASGGGLGGTAAMAAMALPTGALAAAQRGGTAAATSGGPGVSGPTGNTGAPGGRGPASAGGPPGLAGPSGGTGPGAGPAAGGHGTSGGSGPARQAHGPSGSTPGSSSAGNPPAASGSNTAVSSGGSAGVMSASASGAAASGAAAGIGPAGAVASVGMQTVDSARRGINESVGKEVGGPDGAQQ